MHRIRRTICRDPYRSWFVPLGSGKIALNQNDKLFSKKVSHSMVDVAFGWNIVRDVAVHKPQRRQPLLGIEMRFNCVYVLSPKFDADDLGFDR